MDPNFISENLPLLDNNVHKEEFYMSGYYYTTRSFIQHDLCTFNLIKFNSVKELEKVKNKIHTITIEHTNMEYYDFSIYKNLYILSINSSNDIHILIPKRKICICDGDSERCIYYCGSIRVKYIARWNQECAKGLPITYEHSSNGHKLDCIYYDAPLEDITIDITPGLVLADSYIQFTGNGDFYIEYMGGPEPGQTLSLLSSYITGLF